MTDMFEHFLKAYAIRYTEETLLSLFRKGKLFGTTHTCVGQEVSAVAIANALEDNDIIFSNHRCHGHYIAKTDDIEGLLAEIMGRSCGVCGGIGGSQHLCGDNFFSNGIQGGMVPVAAGMAMGHKLRGRNIVTTVCIGDGTLGEGVVYETFNVASIWSLPLLIVLEDNGYSQSTSQHETLAGSISDRARAFGITVYEGSTWEYEALMTRMKDAAEYVRRECRPVFFRVETYRLRAHSKGDDDRDAAEIREYEEKDPLNLFLKSQECNDEFEARLRKIRERINSAVADADCSEFACFAEDASESAGSRSLRKAVHTSEPQLSAINATIEECFDRDDSLVLIGEDIKMPYGGAFKVTKGLSDKFTGRVFNAPISEAAIVGVGTGLALAGCRPVVEIMFGDFLTLAFDQLINQAAKFRMMYNGQVSVPLIIRTPMGAGRGYGPTHSQSIEKHIVGVPGLNVYLLHHRVNIRKFYSYLLKNAEDPSVVLENKLLYAVRGDRECIGGFEIWETDESFPTTVIRHEEAPDITFCAFGRMALISEEAADELYEEEEIVAEMIFPLSISPLDVSVLLDSLKRTKRLLIIEEGTPYYNIGSEVIARLSELWDGEEAFRCRRISSRDMPVPSSGPMEKEFLPSKEMIIENAKEIYNA